MGFHLISKDYDTHVRLLDTMFKMFKDGTEPKDVAFDIDGRTWKLNIFQVKLGLTEIRSHWDKVILLAEGIFNIKSRQQRTSRYQYEDDKIIFNATGPDGKTIHLECIAMPMEMYLLKCQSHAVYDLTRVCGGDFLNALKGYSALSLKNAILPPDSDDSDVPTPQLHNVKSLLALKRRSIVDKLNPEWQ